VTDPSLWKQMSDQWLPEVAAGRMSPSELAERILQTQAQAGLPYQADTDRARRCGFGEVIFGSGKPPELIAEIAQRLIAAGQREVLVTRVERQVARAAAEHFAFARYDLLGRTLRLAMQPAAEPTMPASGAQSPPEAHQAACAAAQAAAGQPRVAVVCAGSTDLPVAREALETLDWMGVAAIGIHDVGVAGPYRLLPYLDQLRQSAAVVVVAGMEGALASVVGGLVASPVIAVPTSVGYGANLQGITTMLSMLSSCAAGVTVVNVDAGFKGGYVAGLIARQCARWQSLAAAQPPSVALWAVS
jgi:NCAIR mutase (PurE)-related protein